MEPVRELIEEVGVPEEGEVKLRPVCKEDFIKALRRIKPVVKPSDVRRYLEWAEKYGEL